MQYLAGPVAEFKILLLAGACLLILAACDQPVPENTETVADNLVDDGLLLSDEETANLGIATVPAEAAEYAPEAQGFGTVVPLSEIAQFDAEITTAQAAATQSAAALERARALQTSVAALSRETLDVAERQATADAAQLALATRSAVAKFGRNAPWLMPRRPANILVTLTSGRTVLVRGTFPLGSLAAALPDILTFSHLDQSTDSRSWQSQEIWEAPADASVPGRSIFALVDGSDFAESERILIGAPGNTPETGIRISSDAVLLSEGAAWFYVRETGGAFTRHVLNLSQAMPGGYFARDGVAPGDMIVTNGASLLLARELNPSTEIED